MLDILVRLADGRSIGIEMEAWPRRVFIEREVYYWSCMHSKQLDAGESYTFAIQANGTGTAGRAAVSAARFMASQLRSSV